jgi:Mg-chelatase subunit ChlD
MPRSLLSASKRTAPGSSGFGASVRAKVLRPMRLAFGAMLLAAFATGPLYADPTFSVRITPEPIASPIKVFVTVTSESGVAPRLEAGDFSVSVDGVIQPLPPENFQLPAALDEEQRVSVVFALDYSSSTLAFQGTMEDAVRAFIGQMTMGDYAAVLKFNNSVPKSEWILPVFTEIDGGNGTSMLESGVTRPFSGSGSPVIDAIDEALKLFASTTLPEGPQAIILASDGGDNRSDSTGSAVVTEANKQGIAVFGIGVGDTSQNVSGREITGAELMQELAGQTGGLYGEATDSTSIDDLYLQVSNLLENEYLLVFPFDVEECTTYDVEVSIDEYSFSETVKVSSRCPSSTGGVSSSSGGGGAFGPLGLIAGLSLLALRRRLMVA